MAIWQSLNQRSADSPTFHGFEPWQARRTRKKRQPSQRRTFGRRLSSSSRRMNAAHSSTSNLANWFAASAAQNSSTLVKTSPMQASNVCAGTIVTKRCVKTTSSTIPFSNPLSVPPNIAACLALLVLSANVHLLNSAVLLTENLYAEQSISRLQERMGMSTEEIRHYRS
jgi:hypothetical protein